MLWVVMHLCSVRDKEAVWNDKVHANFRILHIVVKVINESLSCH